MVVDRSRDAIFWTRMLLLAFLQSVRLYGCRLKKRRHLLDENVTKKFSYNDLISHQVYYSAMVLNKQLGPVVSAPHR